MKFNKAGRRTISLHRETIRVLSGDKLARVIGGADVLLVDAQVAPADDTGNSLVPTVSIRVRCNNP